MEQTDKHETRNLMRLFASASSYYKKSLGALCNIDTNGSKALKTIARFSVPGVQNALCITIKSRLRRRCAASSAPRAHLALRSTESNVSTHVHFAF